MMSDFLLGIALGWPIGVVLTWLVCDFWIVPPLREIAMDYLAHLQRDKARLEQELILETERAFHSTPGESR